MELSGIILTITLTITLTLNAGHICLLRCRRRVGWRAKILNDKALVNVLALIVGNPGNDGRTPFISVHKKEAKSLNIFCPVMFGDYQPRSVLLSVDFSPCLLYYLCQVFPGVLPRPSYRSFPHLCILPRLLAKERLWAILWPMVVFL